MMIASPARKLPDDSVDLDLRSDIDAASRLIEDERSTRRNHPASKQDLLLVSTGKVGHRGLGPRRGDSVVVDLLLSDLLFDPAIETNRGADSVKDRRRYVGCEIKKHEEPLAFPILGKKPESPGNGTGG